MKQYFSSEKKGKIINYGVFCDKHIKSKKIRKAKNKKQLQCKKYIVDQALSVLTNKILEWFSFKSIISRHSSLATGHVRV